MATQVDIGIDQGLKYASSVHCDELVSLLKAQLTDYVGSLQLSELLELDQALAIVVGLGRR